MKTNKVRMMALLTSALLMLCWVCGAFAQTADAPEALPAAETVEEMKLPAENNASEQESIAENVTAQITLGPVEAEVLENTPAPEVTKAPEVTEEPAPEVTKTPEITKAPESTKEPAPEVTKAPEATKEPAPEATKAPESPKVTEAPEGTAAPETTPEEVQPAATATPAPAATNAPFTSGYAYAPKGLEVYSDRMSMDETLLLTTEEEGYVYVLELYGEDHRWARICLAYEADGETGTMEGYVRFNRLTPKAAADQAGIKTKLEGGSDATHDGTPLQVLAATLNEATASSEAAEPSATETTEAAESNETVEVPETTEEPTEESTEASVTTEATETTEAPETTEVTENNETTEATEPTEEGNGTSDENGVAESTEPAASVEPADPAVSTESAESPESTAAFEELSEQPATPATPEPTLQQIPEEAPSVTIVIHAGETIHEGDAITLEAVATGFDYEPVYTWEYQIPGEEEWHVCEEAGGPTFTFVVNRYNSYFNWRVCAE